MKRLKHKAIKLPYYDEGSILVKDGYIEKKIIFSRYVQLCEIISQRQCRCKSKGIVIESNTGNRFCVYNTHGNENFRKLN